MWEQADKSDEGWSTPAKKGIDDMRGLLAQAHNTNPKMSEDHKDQLADENSCSDSLKA